MCLRGRSVLPGNASGWDYGRNGIGITAQYLNDWSPSGSIHFENVNVEGNGYRFFDADDSPGSALRASPSPPRVEVRTPRMPTSRTSPSAVRTSSPAT